MVPYPFAMNHQAENAQVFSKNGAAIQIDEKELSGDIMKNRIVDLLKDRIALSEMGESARLLSMPDSSHDLAKEIMRLAR